MPTFARRRWPVTVLAAGAACLLVPMWALGQTFESGVDIQKQVNGVLALMGYSLTPDVTTGSLSIFNKSTGNPDFGTTSLGGGFTVNKERPLYIEGTAGYSQYDPTFVTSNGQIEHSVAANWEGYSVTGGIGWDFPVAQDLVLRPIANFSLGRVVSETSLSSEIEPSESSKALDFLHKGQLNAYGIGGSLILDYERYRPENEIDVELRYTNINLQSYSDSSTAVQGSADAQSVSLWSRWRAPTGVMLLERPLRYEIEYAHTSFLGDLDGALGFNHLNSFGVGLELDSSKYDILVTRTRLVARYKIGEKVQGWSIGLAVSF